MPTRILPLYIVFGIPFLRRSSCNGWGYSAFINFSLVPFIFAHLSHSSSLWMKVSAKISYLYNYSISISLIFWILKSGLRIIWPMATQTRHGRFRSTKLFHAVQDTYIINSKTYSSIEFVSLYWWQIISRTWNGPPPIKSVIYGIRSLNLFSRSIWCRLASNSLVLI